MLKVLKTCTLFILGSCAIISSPEGGAKDEIPPQIVETTPPNKSTNFKSKEIVIEFDEYIDLQNFSTQFFSSPPLSKRVGQKLKGKKLYITLNEELLQNTTYTFSFGNSITDYTENNIQADFKYVFSTGAHLDSLSIFGKALDAYTGAPQEGVIALLHPATLYDSTLLKQKPVYYTITNSEGYFSIDNLALDTFQLFVVQDENINLIYDHGAEKYGFVSYPIISGVEESHEIRMFKQSNNIKLLEASQKGSGRILVSFNKPITNPEISVVGSENFPKLTTSVIEADENGDTLNYWFNPKEYPEDLPFFLLNIKTDQFQEDSVRVMLKSKAISGVNLAQGSPGSLVPEGDVLLESNVPIISWQKDLFKLRREKEEIPFEILQDDHRHFRLKFDRKYGDVQSLFIEPQALTSIFATENDSIILKTKVALEEDLAILLIRLSSIDNKNKIFQLFKTEDRVVIEEHPFVNKLDLDLKDVQPTKYGIRIIWDDNNNGVWDVGDFSSRRQPEQVMYYPKPIEVRANWELETVWEIPSK